MNQYNVPTQQVLSFNMNSYTCLYNFRKFLSSKYLMLIEISVIAIYKCITNMPHIQDDPSK